MTSSVVPCSVSNILLFPGIALAAGKANNSKRCYLSRTSSKHTLSFHRFALPPPASVSLFSPYKRSALLHRLHTLSATGTDVAVDESETPVVDENSTNVEESSSKAAPGSSPAPARRSRTPRKSDMPPVKNEDLVIGATFTGKVKSIQPFGAFVDIGAFTEGLVHVSRLSEGFVKDVGSIVAIGQEVKVRVVEVNFEKNRIGLSMREEDDGSRPTQQKDTSGGPSPARKGPPKSGPPRSGPMKTSKFEMGENLVGTVKNLTKSGAFILLPGEEEGFLPRSEENSEGFASVLGESSLVVGKEVKVQVLRTNRGKVRLTMKDESTGQRSDSKTDQELAQSEDLVRTNAFMLAFRKNKDIAKFLDERDKQEKIAADESAVDEKASSKEASPIADGAELSIEKEEEASSEILAPEGTVGTTTDANVDIPESIASSLSPAVDGAELSIEKEEEVSSEILAPEGSVSITDEIIEEASPKVEVESEKKSESSEDTPDEVVSSEGTIAQVEEAQADSAESKDEVGSEKKSESSEDTPDVVVSSEGTIAQVEEAQADSAESKGEVESEKKSESSEDTPDEVVSSEGTIAQVEEAQADSAESKDEVDIEAPTTENEVPAVEPVLEELTSLPDENSNATSSDGQPPQETKASISPAIVKQLREETGAGMMDCKNALLETEGDIEKAQEFLRKKGLASADKKASRATAEGRIGSYIHDGRIGVLVEVNCETDFVSRGDIFKELVDDLAMQVAACPQVNYVDTEDVPEEFVNKEKDLEMQKEDLLSKPEQMRSRIVEGRIRKRLEELALLEQPFIKNDKVVVKDWVKQTIATVGENMKVKRFVRFNLGEGLEKKSQDFAAEVAAQTAAKSEPVPEKEQPTPVEAEAKDTVETRPASVAISAAVVKQLREETGAGMMDCKKALSETGGDLEKAQEYLRKKGLSSADKKSSRLAAEGRIGSYIHDSRIGVLIEVNCETDFVGRSEKFKELVDDLAMQVVASPLVQYVSIEDIPESMVQKEKELEMQRDDLQSKPENIREKIVEGRVLKRLGALALVEQPFIKDDSVLVKDLVKQTIAAIGENIKVRRFVRFTLGETN